MDEQELQKEFAQYLVKESGANSEKELQEYLTANLRIDKP